MLRLLKRLQNLLIVDKKQLDLRDQKKVIYFLKKNKPGVFIAAAKVGAYTQI